MFSAKHVFITILLLANITKNTDAMREEKFFLLNENNIPLIFRGDVLFPASIQEVKQHISLHFMHLDPYGNQADGRNFNCVTLLCGEKKPTKNQLAVLSSYLSARFEKALCSKLKPPLCFFTFCDEVFILAGLADSFAPELANPTKSKLILLDKKNGIRLYLHDSKCRQAFLCECRKNSPNLEDSKKPIFLKFFCDKNQKDEEKTYTKVVLMCGNDPATEEEQITITNCINALMNTLQSSPKTEDPGNLKLFNQHLSVMNKYNNKEAGIKNNANFLTVVFEDPTIQQPKMIPQKMAPLADSCEIYPEETPTQNPRFLQEIRTIQHREPKRTNVLQQNRSFITISPCCNQHMKAHIHSCEIIAEKKIGDIIYERKTTLNGIQVHIKQFFVRPSQEPACRFHDAFNLVCLMFSKSDSSVKEKLGKPDWQERIQNDLDIFLKSQNSYEDLEPVYADYVSALLWNRLHPDSWRNITIIKTNDEKNIAANIQLKAKNYLNKNAQSILIAFGSRWLGIKIEKDQNGGLMVWTTNSNQNEDITNHPTIDIICQLLLNQNQ